MTFSVNYNGVELSELVSGFTAIDRGFGSVWNNTLSNQVARYGQSFVKNTLSAKKITITIRKSGIPSDWIALRKELAKVLDVNEPAPLIFGDEPNKVWYAVADGTQALSEDISNLVASGTLTFIVPEGHAYSTYTNVLNSDNSGGVNGSITPNADGSVDITINNQGTLPTWIDLKLTNNHDNGYFGIAGVNGSLELGNREEVDGVTIKHSDILYDSKTDPKFSKFVSAAGQPHPEWTGAGTNGTIGYQEYNYKSSNGQQKTMKGVKLINPGSQTGFRGGMAELVLPPDSNGDSGAVNFYAWFRLFTWTTVLGQTGVMQILFTDIVPELKDVAIHKVKFFFGNWSTNPRGTMTHMVIRDFWCRKDFVNTWNDLPNLYKNGSVVEIDMASGNVSKDGISAITEVVNGTEPFSIPPGISQIKIIQSSWNNTPPDVEISWQERIL
ncbi:hypothetical protein CHPC974_001234 [Lactococcus phage CHPC974]|nr:hypothetical protein CHPC974_001234 [Lactococcus phage CHPC974]